MFTNWRNDIDFAVLTGIAALILAAIFSPACDTTESGDKDVTENSNNLVTSCPEIGNAEPCEVSEDCAGLETAFGGEMMCVLLTTGEGICMEAVPFASGG